MWFLIVFLDNLPAENKLQYEEEMKQTCMHGMLS